MSGDRRRWLPVRLSVHVLGMVLLAAGVTWLVFTELGARLPGTTDFERKPFEGPKTAIGVVGSLGAIVALTVAYRRQRDNEAAEHRLNAAEERENTRLFNERFSTATDLLSGAGASQRRSGVFGIAALADDWNQGRQMCINVLCSYLQDPYDPPKHLSDDATPEEIKEQRARRQEGRVRMTIMDIIGERLRANPIPGQTWHGHNFDLSESTIQVRSLYQIKITGGTFDLSGATFLDDINLSQLKMTGGRLNLSNTRITGRPSFIAAEISGGTIEFLHSLIEASVGFTGIKMTGGTIDFFIARIRGFIYFWDAHLSGGTIRFESTGVEDSSGLHCYEDIAGIAIDFGSSQLGGTTIDFTHATAIRPISFKTATFAGSKVKLSRVVRGQDLVITDEFSEGPPSGLDLPEST